MQTTMPSNTGAVTVQPDAPIPIIYPPHSPDGTKTSITRHLADLEVALRQPDNLAPVTAASFALLRAVIPFAMPTRDNDVLGDMEVGADLLHN